MSDRRAPRLVLASASPRRRQLLRVLGLPHIVRPAHIDETCTAGESVLAYVERMAREKALAVAADAETLPTLGSDTVVEIDGEPLGKPQNVPEAETMLRRLAGKMHHVHTAVALVAGGRCRSLVDTAEVHFKPSDESAIRWYVATGEPMDKAGAYAIQGAGGLLVDHITGSPHTVVGLPIHRLTELFAELGLELLDMLEGPGNR